MKELDTVISNISRIQSELSRELEIFLAQSQDASFVIADVGVDEDTSSFIHTARARYLEFMEKCKEICIKNADSTADCNRNRVLYALEEFSVLFGVEAAYGLLKDKISGLLPRKMQAVTDTAYTVALCSNRYSQKAYSFFEKKFGQFELLECMDFSSMCELMDARECDFCIMPYCDSDGARIETFSRLRLLNDLFICDSYLYEAEKDDGEDEGNDMSFCLLSPEPISFTRMGTLSLQAVVGVELDKLIRICKYCGARLKNCYHVGGELASDGVYELFLDCSAAELDKLVCSVELEFPRYKFTGMYKDYL